MPMAVPTLMSVVVMARRAAAGTGGFGGRLPRRDGLKRHAAFRAGAKMILPDLGVHRAGVDHARRGCAGPILRCGFTCAAAVAMRFKSRVAQRQRPLCGSISCGCFLWGLAHDGFSEFS
ncbi:hypothetical protein C7830_07520 [Pandoraea apista]|nr:hypothetical protein C7830_07520 [Pandoraea apista]